MAAVDLSKRFFASYSDAEDALRAAHFEKKFDCLASERKYNWEYGLVDAGIRPALPNGWRIVERA